MSRRNSHDAKRQRRAEREAHHAAAARDRAAGLPSAEIHELDEMYDLAARGERLPCGCDAHELLHSMQTGDGWERL